MDHSKSSGNRLLKLTPPIEPTQCTSRLPLEAPLPLFHYGNGVGRAYLILSAVIWKKLRQSKP